jgi:type 1 fimbria pilin
MKKLILTLALVAMGTVAYAQDNVDNISATAAVQAPLTVDGVEDLEFGDVFPGVEKTIARTDAGAGKFEIVGQNSATVFLNFDLPTQLANATPTNMPVSFSATSAGTNTTDTQGTAVDTNPNTEDISKTLSASGELFVWLGGTVDPDIGQEAGNYSATVTLTVTYD